MHNRFKYMLFGAVAIGFLAACGGSGETDAPNGTVTNGSVVKLETPPGGQLPTGVTPTAYRLSLVTDPTEDTYSGSNEIDIELDAPHARIWLHSLGPVVTSAIAITANGEEIAASFTGNQAEGGVSRLDFDSAVPRGKATLVLDFTAPYNRNLAGLYRADQNDTAYLASQMEPIDARRAFPSFDEPRFKTPWSVTITAPDGNEVVTNGALKSRTRLANGQMQHVFETTRPIQTYLIAFAVGPYDRVDGDPIPANALRADPIPFRGFAAAGKGEKLTEAMAATDALLTIQENYFGVPYPYGKLDLIAAPDFAYGAMENAGAIVYRESALLIDERTSLARKRRILTTHAHELAHQWFGNLVTPKWWNDIWLNEAFATWFSYKTMHAYDPEGGWDRNATRAALGVMAADSLINARQIRNPIEKNGDIMYAFDGITYRKGGGVLAMFEAYLGEDAFREGIRVHMARYADGVADVNDFMSSLADGSGKPEVVDAFNSFILQPGIPTLDVQVICATPEGDHLKITQSRYAPLGSAIDPDAATWTIPFASRLSGPAGEATIRQMLTEKTTEIALDGGCADWVMPNASGAGYWRFSTNSENWAGLSVAFGDLTPGEQLVYADSLTASFEAGHMSATDMLAGLEVTATGTWDAAQQPLGDLQTYLGLLPDAEKPALRTWIRDTYRPIYDRLVAAQQYVPLNQGDQLLHDRLHGLLAGAGRDPAIRADLLGKAGRYVGINLEPDPSVLPASQLGAAIAVAAQESGQAFFDTALEYALSSENQSERSTILSTLARNSGPQQVAILLKAANGDRFSGREMYSTFLNSLGNERAQDQAWVLFTQSWMNLAARTPEARKGRLASAAGAFCDIARANEAADFFRANAADIPGYERSLAQGLERAELCVALKAAKADELIAALE